MSEVAAYNTVISILANIFPSHVPKVVAYIEMLYGLGYAMGPVVVSTISLCYVFLNKMISKCRGLFLFQGSTLYLLGGFNLPFTVAGSIGITVATCLLILIPNDGSSKKEEESDKDGEKQLTFTGMLKVYKMFVSKPLVRYIHLNLALLCLITESFHINSLCGQLCCNSRTRHLLVNDGSSFGQGH